MEVNNVYIYLCVYISTTRIVCIDIFYVVNILACVRWRSNGAAVGRGSAGEGRRKRRCRRLFALRTKS